MQQHITNDQILTQFIGVGAAEAQDVPAADSFVAAVCCWPIDVVNLTQ